MRFGQLYLCPALVAGDKAQLARSHFQLFGKRGAVGAVTGGRRSNTPSKNRRAAAARGFLSNMRRRCNRMRRMEEILVVKERKGRLKKRMGEFFSDGLIGGERHAYNAG